MGGSYFIDGTLTNYFADCEHSWVYCDEIACFVFSVFRARNRRSPAQPSDSENSETVQYRHWLHLSAGLGPGSSSNPMGHLA